jgi:exodeoxyribonuclease VII small subunit
MEKEELSFEEAVSRLESIVSAMEMGTLPLQDCLKQFEEAVALSRHCATKLEEAEAAIRILDTDGSMRPAHELSWTLEDSGA